MTEQEALIVLNAVPGMGNNRIRRLVKACGTAQQVWKASESDLVERIGLPPEVARSLSTFNRDDFLEKENHLILKTSAQVITFWDDDYPRPLREIPDAPVVLYIKGRWQKEDECSLAIVGARRASVYGTTVAEKFSCQLAEMGITIVSGLARGIDTAAHRGSLLARGRTLAILGCGLAEIYPPENRELYDKVAQNGAIISEFPMLTGPYAFNFPRRNRIISGLALGVLVVEATQRSGALITSDFALDQGREVFAVPGRVDTSYALGTHQLIKSGAKLVSSVEDILEELAPRLRKFAPAASPPSAAQAGHAADSTRDVSTPALSKTEQKILSILRRHPIGLEEIALQSEEKVETVMPVLLTLELKRLITQWPGKFFTRK